jgi:hypothetical protein
LKIHRVIWYNYFIHVDRIMECSPKLAAWAVQGSKPYLTTYQPNSLLVDTLSTRWELYQDEQEESFDTKSTVNDKSEESIGATDSAYTQLTTTNIPPDGNLAAL